MGMPSNRALRSHRAISTAEIAIEPIPVWPKLRIWESIDAQAPCTRRASMPSTTPASLPLTTSRAPGWV
jgi:hypothetical protein